MPGFLHKPFHVNVSKTLWGRHDCPLLAHEAMKLRRSPGFVLQVELISRWLGLVFRFWLWHPWALSLGRPRRLGRSRGAWMLWGRGNKARVWNGVGMSARVTPLPQDWLPAVFTSTCLEAWAMFSCFHEMAGSLIHFFFFLWLNPRN